MQFKRRSRSNGSPGFFPPPRFDARDFRWAQAAIQLHLTNQTATCPSGTHELAADVPQMAITLETNVGTERLMGVGYSTAERQRMLGNLQGQITLALGPCCLAKPLSMRLPTTTFGTAASRATRGT